VGKKLGKGIDPEIYTEKITTNNKTFLIDLKENQGGFYLKVSEWSNNKKSSIYIPSEGIKNFIDSFIELQNMILEREKSKSSQKEQLASS
jgi:hypothetical protein